MAVGPHTGPTGRRRSASTVALPSPREQRKLQHWRELLDKETGRIQCRPKGSPAGTWPHTPIWHCMFHDSYEALNFWSHCVPGAMFLFAGLLAFVELIPGGAALAVFGLCSAMTHLFSAISHVFPDNLYLEKLDHIGILATIVGTPLTTCLAGTHNHVPFSLQIQFVALLGCAFLKPLPRVTGFTLCTVALIFLHVDLFFNAYLATEVALYGMGALFFLRNGGHSRWPWLSDHHILHYMVTAASALHVKFLLKLVNEWSPVRA